MKQRSALTIAWLAAAPMALLLAYLIFAGAGPLAVAITAFGLGFAVRNAIAIRPNRADQAAPPSSPIATCKSCRPANTTDTVNRSGSGTPSPNPPAPP